MSMVIDGTNGVTFPTGSNAQGAPSKVIQVVNNTYNNSTSTSSTSPVATGLSATITPLFSTSKILAIVHSVITNTSGQATQFYLYRGTTQVTPGPFMAYNNSGGVSGYIWVPGAFSAIDSPASTSSLTYNLYFSVNGGTGYISNGNYTGMTLMEIAQ